MDTWKNGLCVLKQWRTDGPDYLDGDLVRYQIKMSFIMWALLPLEDTILSK